MKQLVYFGLLASAFFACSTPATETKTEMVDTRFEDAILEKAMKRNDVGTALNTIHVILEKDTTRITLYDTLFQLYLDMQNPAGLADVGLILLQTKPNDLAILEATSAGLTSTMQLDKALEIERRMFAISGDPRLKIRIAMILFEQKQTDLARQEIQWVIDHREVSDTMRIEQAMPSVKDKTQMVSMRAIAYYTLGELEMGVGNKKEAIRLLNKALEVDPRFDMAATALLQIDN